MFSNVDQYIQQNILQLNQDAINFENGEVELLIRNENQLLMQDMSLYKNVLEQEAEEYVMDHVKFRNEKALSEEEKAIRRQGAIGKKIDEINKKIDSIQVHEYAFDLNLDPDVNINELKKQIRSVILNEQKERCKMHFYFVKGLIKVPKRQQSMMI